MEEEAVTNREQVISGWIERQMHLMPDPPARPCDWMLWRSRMAVSLAELIEAEIAHDRNGRPTESEINQRAYMDEKAGAGRKS